MGKTALVTGASSGIGKITAIELKNKGFNVYAAARRIEKMKDLEEKGINITYVDVTNDESMVKCVDEIIKKEGSIDVLVNSAGYGSYGAIEDVPIQEARKQVEVNLIGLARMTQLVLPKMRENKFGKIINITSMGGIIWTPFGGWYHATKFAVEGFSDSLRIEVSDYNINVVIIEPSVIRTPWGSIAVDNLKKTSGNGAYADSANKVADKLTEYYKSNLFSDSSVIAKAIVKAVTSKKPKTRYLVGRGAKLAVFTRRLLGDKGYDKMIKKILG